MMEIRVFNETLDSTQIFQILMPTLALIAIIVAITFGFLNYRKKAAPTKQTDLTEKVNKRIIVLDCVDNFLVPCLNEMKLNLININDSNFYWNQSNGKSQISWIWNIADFKNVARFAKVDVFKNQPELEALCSEYDELHDEIIQVYNEIGRTIKNTEKTDCLKDFVQEFLKTGYVLEDDAITDPINYFLQVFVNYNYYRKYDLDKNGGTKLLNFDEKIVDCIKTTEYEKIDKIRNEKIDAFKEKIGEIIENVDKNLYRCRKEYDIPVN